MDHVGVVSMLKAFAQVLDQPEAAVERQRAAVDMLRERFARHEFHGDERAACMFTDVIDRDYVRMGQSCDRTRLAADSLSQDVAPEPLAHELDRDQATEGRISGEVDGTHAAATDSLDDLI